MIDALTRGWHHSQQLLNFLPLGILFVLQRFFSLLALLAFLLKNQCDRARTTATTNTPWTWLAVSEKNKMNTCYPQQLESFCIFAIKSAYAIKIKRLCHKKSAYAIKRTSEPFGISQSICTRTLRNLTRYLHRQNPPEPHQASSPPKPSGTSQGICTGTFRNLTRYLPRNPPEPHHASSPRPSGTSSGSCTGNFRNLTRYLHQNPLESRT